MVTLGARFVFSIGNLITAFPYENHDPDVSDAEATHFAVWINSGLADVAVVPIGILGAVKSKAYKNTDKAFHKNTVPDSLYLLGFTIFIGKSFLDVVNGIWWAASDYTS